MSDPYDFAADRLLPGKVEAIRAFWQRFEAGAEDLDRAFDTGEGIREVSTSVMGALAEVSPHLMWEFGPSERGHSICITPEWRHDLRPAARAVAKMAPEMRRFEVLEARTPSKLDVWEGDFVARFRKPATLSRIEVQPGEDGKVRMIGTGSGTDKEIGNDVLALGTLLLGEQVDWNWFGDVEIVRQKKKLFGGWQGGEPMAFDAEAFIASFDDARARLEAARPDTPYSDCDVEEGERSLLKLRGGHPGCGRTDLIMMNTRSEVHALAACTTARFSSINHSRFGEWFFFVRIPRGPEATFDQVDERYEVEELLHGVLSGAGLGGLVAGAHGQDHVYVDIAATDLDAALPLVAMTLREHPYFKDTTIHFLEQGLPEIAFPVSSFLVRQS